MHLANLGFSGGIIPSADIQIVKLLKYNESTDYILMAVECLFIIFIIYYLVEESIEINVHGCAYFANPGLSCSISDKR